MRIKRKNGLKIAAITIALLLCLALAVGITGAWYQAKRQATGTLSMDQGIIIDYKGFNGSETGATWERGTTFELFSTKAGEVQPGAHIKVNAASIKANAKSVNFYARVRLEYKFYNGDTEVTLEDPTVLIKASNLFGSNWEFSSMAAPKDYYYYVENGTTTFKTMEAGADFVELIQSNAEFIIEGEGFVGADNNGASGGFVVDETTSINKIVVNLVLETLQGDADPATEGWKIASQVDFAKVDEGKIVKSNTTEVVTDEQLNVTINGKQTTLETVKFPYGEETVLEFDSKNVEYVELKYSDNKTERFYELEASENSATKNSQIQVLADESHGTVKGYVVGLWDSEYKGFTYSTIRYGRNEEGEAISYPISEGVVLSGYWGVESAITIPAQAKVRERNFKAAVLTSKDYTDYNSWRQKIDSLGGGIWQFPCTINGTETINAAEDFEAWINGEISELSAEEFMARYPKFILTYSILVESTFGTTKNVIAIRGFTFRGKTDLVEVTILDGVESVDEECFSDCSNLQKVNLPNSLISIGELSFGSCSKLTTINIPNQVTSIGAQAFQLSGLTEITIGESVKDIGAEAFRGCSDLTTVIIDSAIIAGMEYDIEEYLLNNATSVYVKTGLTVGTHVTNSFTKAESSDKAGYDMYTKKA